MADYNLNINVTGTPSLAGENKEFYYRTLLDNAEPKLVHLQLGTAYPIPTNGGKTIEMRKYTPLAKAMTPLTEGVTPDGGTLSMTTLKATIKQYGYYVAISDILEKTAIDNNVTQASILLGSQSGRTLDSLCRDELCGGTNVLYASKEDGTEVVSRKGLSADCQLTMDMIFDAAAQLKAMNAEPMQGGYYVAVCHPYVLNDLMKSQDWKEAHKYQNAQAIFDGEVGVVGGVRFLETTEAKIWKDDTCPDGLAVHGVLVLGKDAFGKTEVQGLGLEHIIHDKSQAGGPLEQWSTVGWKATHVTKRLAEEFMVRIECCSSRSASVQAN